MRSWILLGLCFLTMACTSQTGESPPKQEHDVTNLKRLTPVLTVERIEPCVELWEKRLGFTRTAEVPEGDHLGFIILARDGIEIMYQTWSSLEQDIAPLGRDLRTSRQFLFIEVEDLAAIEAQLKGVAYVVPTRTTSYGMREVIIRDPAGHAITFAQPIRDD